MNILFLYILLIIFFLIKLGVTMDNKENSLLLKYIQKLEYNQG